MVTPKDKAEDSQSKTYSLDELKDLQSKLMLIAGKAERGKDEVERFAKVSKLPISNRHHDVSRPYRKGRREHFRSAVASKQVRCFEGL